MGFWSRRCMFHKTWLEAATSSTEYHTRQVSSGERVARQTTSSYEERTVEFATLHAGRRTSLKATITRNISRISKCKQWTTWVNSQASKRHSWDFPTWWKRIKTSRKYLLRLGRYCRRGFCRSRETRIRHIHFHENLSIQPRVGEDWERWSLENWKSQSWWFLHSMNVSMG